MHLKDKLRDALVAFHCAQKEVETADTSLENAKVACGKAKTAAMRAVKCSGKTQIVFADRLYRVVEDPEDLIWNDFDGIVL